MARLIHFLAGWHLVNFPLRTEGAHYSCSSDDVVGELQGETGVVCGPRCRDSTFDCPTDVPTGTMAQPQCMLQDVDQAAYCSLVCQSDAQCPSGASCRRPANADVNVCVHPVSFSEWAKQSSRKKLAVGWPAKAGQSSKGFQIAKAYAALQSLKRRYSIADGDADVLIVKELLSATSTGNLGAVPPSAGPAPPTPSPPTISAKPQAALVQNGPSSSGSTGGGQGGDPGSMLAPFKHDIGYFAQNMRDGLPGVERELHDTVWNLEHLNRPNVATEMLRSVLLIALVYVGGGCVYKYHALGARGMEMVPHIGFWMDYPQLVADGVKYSMMMVNDCLGQSSARGMSFPGSSDRDTFAHFEPSK